jgi:hypothetical protein
MRPKDFFYPRYVVTLKYPHSKFQVGDVLDANEFEGKIYLSGDKTIYPDEYKEHFKKLRWHDHRTIEQLSSIKYMKVVSGSSYYVVGDIVEVLDIHYNDKSLVGGRCNILFNLKGHYFTASQLEPATKEEHDNFWNKK